MSKGLVQPPTNRRVYITLIRISNLGGMSLSPIQGVDRRAPQATYNISGIAVTGALSAVHRVMLEVWGFQPGGTFWNLLQVSVGGDFT